MSFDGERKKHALEALQTILSFEKQMPVDFDFNKELTQLKNIDEIRAFEYTIT